MGQLQQDGACPADQDKAFCVDSARRVGGGQRVVSQVPTNRLIATGRGVAAADLAQVMRMPGSAKCARNIRTGA